MIRPEKYNKRIVAHPEVESPYDLAVCGASMEIVLHAIEESTTCTITNIASILGINRDRASSAIKTLGIRHLVDTKRAEYIRKRRETKTAEVANNPA